MFDHVVTPPLCVLPICVAVLRDVTSLAAIGVATAYMPPLRIEFLLSTASPFTRIQCQLVQSQLRPLPTAQGKPPGQGIPANPQPRAWQTASTPLKAQLNRRENRL
jgi:hypothetical protein